MGILEIAVAALSVMGGTTVGSAITGAVMGSRREIGAFRDSFGDCCSPWSASEGSG